MNSQQKSEMHSYLPPASWLIHSKARPTVKTSALGKRHVPGLILREAESLLGSPVQMQELRELPTRFNAVRCWTAASVKKKKRESGQQLLNRVCRGEGATYPNVWHKDLFSQPQELFGTGLWFLSFCKLRGLMQASANQLHGPIPFVKCLANTCLTSLGGSTPISGKLAKTGGEDITCPLPVTYALMSHLHIFI